MRLVCTFTKFIANCVCIALSTEFNLACAQTCATKKNEDICTQAKLNCILPLLQSTDSRGSLGSENSSPERGVVRRRRQFGKGRGARGSSESDESNVVDTNTAEQERTSYEEPLLQGTLGSYGRAK